MGSAQSQGTSLCTKDDEEGIMFWKKKTSVIVLHVNTGNLPSDRAKARMADAIADVRKYMSLKDTAKVLALQTVNDSYIEIMQIDSNLIGE